MYSNTLDPDVRFRGRHESFGTIPVLDANALLAPVHVVTLLQAKTHVVSFDRLTSGYRINLAYIAAAANSLPPPLQLIVPGIQSVLASEVQLAETPAGTQQLVASLVRKIIDDVKGHRTIQDKTRVQSVQLLLKCLAGTLENRVQLAQPDRLKFHKKKAFLRRQLEVSAKAVKNHYHYCNDYDDLSKVFAMSLEDS